MKEAHVFVCHGALSLDAASRIAHGALPSGTPTYFLVSFAADLTKLPSQVVPLVMSPPADAYSEWAKPFAVQAWFSTALARLGQDEIDTIVAYLPHPFEIPGNHLAYSDERVVRLELLPDGLANFLPTSVAPEGWFKRLRFEARVQLRRLAAMRDGLRYVPVRAGHLTQFDRLDYAATWVEPGLRCLTIRGQVRSLPPRLQAASETRSSEMKGDGALASRGRPIVLFLDQELRGFVSPKLEVQMRAAVDALLRSLEPKCVYYKSHPRGENRAPLLGEIGAKVIDISGGELAEELVVEHAVTHLVGFYSTPLLTCASAVETRLSVLPDVGTDGVLKPALARDLRAALRSSGVELCGVPYSPSGAP